MFFGPFDRPLDICEYIAMLHFKCPKCKKFIPVSEEKADKDMTCADCGSALILLKPVEGAADKAKEKPRPAPEPVSTAKPRGLVGEEDRVEEEKPQRKKKKKKKPILDSDEDDDGELKPRKKRDKNKSDGNEDDGGDPPLKMYSDVEGADVLGPQKEIFTQGNSAIRIAAISCCVLAAGGMLTCVLSMVSKMPDAAIPFTIVAIVGGMGGFLWCMKSLTLKVALHAGGFVFSHRAKTQIVPWEEIASVYYAVSDASKNSGPGGKNFTYTIELKDRTEFVFTNALIKDVDRLGNIIIDKTSVLIMPQVRVKYERGEMFDFGRLGVNTQGLHYRKQLLAWDEIEGVKVADGYLTVNRQGKWVRWRDIEASSVPNLNVFLAFANEVLESHAG
jgi:DNA-directed RNA polymerase subunit RPC12/RpoP